MTLCVNQSGTYRNITTLCVNQSGTYRDIKAGAINQSGTYRNFLFKYSLGCPYGGGILICSTSSLKLILAPNSTQVSGSWHSRNNAVTTAQSVTGCTGWFIPDVGLLYCSYSSRGYWDSYEENQYWSNSESSNPAFAYAVDFNHNSNHRFPAKYKHQTSRIRAFRCVTY